MGNWAVYKPIKKKKKKCVVRHSYLKLPVSSIFNEVYNCYNAIKGDCMFEMGSLSPQDKYISVQKWVQTIMKENKILRHE